MSLRVGVYGGSGYAGAELVRLLAGHPKVGALTVASRGDAGRRIGGVFRRVGAAGALGRSWFCFWPGPRRWERLRWRRAGMRGVVLGRSFRRSWRTVRS